MSEKRLTLEETFIKYKNKEFYIRLYENKHNIKVNFIVVGYMKKTNYLIGELIKNQGITGHFKKLQGCDHIENYKDCSTYVYVNIGRVEKYAKIKKEVRKRIEKEVEQINIDILEF